EKVRTCRQETVELVLVGGSPVAEGLDPSVLAGVCWQGQRLEHVYNLGLSGGTAMDFCHAVEHGLAVPPRLLVYRSAASGVDDDRDEPHGPAMLMDAGDIVRFVLARPQSAEWCIRQYARERLARLWQLYSHRNAIRLWTADEIEQLLPGACPEVAQEAREGL